MRIRYLTGSALASLRAFAKSSPAKYDTEIPWVDSFFGQQKYSLESNFEVETLPTLINPTSGTVLYELENAKLIYEAFRVLTPSQAADERLWAWLCHGPYWGYMRARWPVLGGQHSYSYVLEHYFLGDSRAMVRNGLARLWWFAHSTYDAERQDPYELTTALLQTTDARQQLTERQFWRNRDVLKAFLDRVIALRKDGVDFYTPREDFRRLCKGLNLAGGSMLLDAMGADRIGGLVDELALAIRPAPESEG